MQDSPATQTPMDDEITLKDIILKLQHWWSVVWPKKNIIIALSLFVGALSALYTKFLNPRYISANISIVL